MLARRRVKPRQDWLGGHVCVTPVTHHAAGLAMEGAGAACAPGHRVLPQPPVVAG